MKSFREAYNWGFRRICPRCRALFKENNGVCYCGESALAYLIEWEGGLYISLGPELEWPCVCCENKEPT